VIENEGILKEVEEKKRGFGSIDQPQKKSSKHNHCPVGLLTLGTWEIGMVKVRGMRGMMDLLIG
jgi:hypothetical protein